jgi:hypothetical protein
MFNTALKDILKIRLIIKELNDPGIA